MQGLVLGDLEDRIAGSGYNHIVPLSKKQQQQFI